MPAVKDHVSPSVTSRSPDSTHRSRLASAQRAEGTWPDAGGVFVDDEHGAKQGSATESLSPD